MNKEYFSRIKKAKEICEKIKGLSEGVLVVGSVAYNKEAVTSKSDLDMVVVLDFAKTDFREFHSRIGRDYEETTIRNAKEGKIQNFSVVWDEEFEIGLHLWDINAFRRVISLEKYNFVFRPDKFDRNFNSTSEVETLKNLNGNEKEIFKDPEKINGGTRMKFFVYWEDGSGFYPGVQMSNLLLSPAILYEKKQFISKGIKKLESSLKIKLKEKYGSFDEGKNLFLAHKGKLQSKMGKDLKEKLINFI